jgi:hypothetical protein
VNKFDGIFFILPKVSFSFNFAKQDSVINDIQTNITADNTVCFFV